MAPRVVRHIMLLLLMEFTAQLFRLDLFNLEEDTLHPIYTKTGQHETHDIWQLKLMFSEPLLFQNQSVDKAYRFMELHHSHRQLLYGTVQLDCDEQIFSSEPSDENYVHIGPCSPTDSKFKWLNQLCYHMPSRNELVLYLKSATPHCTVEFTQGWFGKLALPHSSQFKFSNPTILITRHLHVVHNSSWTEVGDTSFLMTEGMPFMDILMPPMIDQIIGPVVPFLASKVTVKLIGPLLNSLGTYLSGTKSPGAKPGAGGGLGAGLLTADMFGMSPSLLEQDLFFKSSDFQDRIQAEMPRMRQYRRIRTQLEKGGGGEDKDGKLVEDITIMLIETLTPALSISLTNEISDGVSEIVVGKLAMELLKDYVPSIGKEKVTELLTPAYIQLLGDAVPAALARLLIPGIITSITKPLARSLTRALTQSLTASIAFTNEPNMDLMARFNQTYYSHYYAAYYSDFTLAN